jgi:gliding motility-associated-like protein
VVTFANPGTYSVKLVIQNATGIAELERIDYITVYPAPTADFSSNLTLGCVPTTIQFTDQSSPAGSIVSWQWDFGDGNTSTSQNPTNTYTNVGFYTVTLTVTNNTGCRTTISKGSYIRIVGSIFTDFSFSQPTTCQAPFTINFQNQSGGPGNISYTWDFGNSQTSTTVNPSTVYNSPGTYTVTLNAQSDLGCSGSAQQTITITGITTDFTAPTNSCINQPVTFQNSSSAPPVSSSWDFGDGTGSAQINPVKTYLTPGTYDVKLINQYSGCTDSITKTITVNDKPVVDFTVNDSTACQSPFPVQFTDLTPGAVSWQWDFGDGNTSTQQNPTHTYASTGNYTVTLTVSTGGGCSNTITKPNFIRIQPTSISLNLPNGGCIPYTYNAQAIFQTLDTIATYSWDLGEPGAVFNVRNPPPYTYTTAGNFTVTLTITTVSGCTVTASGIVNTGVRPIVNFTFAPLDACASDTIQFTDLSVTTPGAVVGWEWSFGDGGSSGDQHPRYVYTDTGYLTAMLIVSNNRCIDSLKQTVHVRPPVARFLYTVNCITGQVTFTDTSLVDPALSPTTYQWSMGDPANTQFSVRNPPPFTYPGPGTYNVTLVVTNGACSYETTLPVIIANEPADFTINRNPVCKNETFTLTATNSNAANITSYEWTVGGTVLPDASRSVTYSLPNTGTYDVTLTILDINGCITTRTITNYIAVTGPNANFTPSPPGACLNKAIAFTDLTTPAGTITSWSFDFGDGTQQNYTVPPFTHTYQQLGGYTVSMTVTDQAGCTGNFTYPTDILVTNPVAGFRADTFYCPMAPLQFADTSIGAGLTYQWNFGDGGTSTLQNPQHSYAIGDNDYSVTLIVTDISGCTDTIAKPNYIKIRSPKAAFGIRDTASICPPLGTTFTFQGSDYQSYYWDFGDGITLTTNNPVITHYYSTYGSYTPTLNLIGPGGCTATASSTVNIYDPNVYTQITYGPQTTACNSLNVNFNVSVPPGFKFHFHFGDGTVDSSGQLNFSHLYPTPSFNFPQLVIFDTISGCKVWITGSTWINVLGAVPLFGKDRSEFCDTGTVVFRDFTVKNEPIINTLWDFGDGATSGLQDPVHTYTQPGMYIVTLNITTQSNCSSSYRDTVFVHRTPIPIINGRDTICTGIAELYNGTIAVADTMITWLWNLGNGQTSVQQNNIVTFNESGNYTLQLITTNKLGCSDTTNKIIYVTPPPTATPVQDPLTIISGASTDLQMDYTGNITTYNWSPNQRLSCANCPIPVANPQFTTTYRVDLIDTYGCRNSGNITVVVVCNNQNFFVPNTFSPNGDGQNETFFPRGSGLYNVKSMTVFNRWGQVVFDRRNFAVNDPSAGWNGTFNGQKASADVYVYMIEILCDNNTVIPVKGNVTLLR